MKVLRFIDNPVYIELLGLVNGNTSTEISTKLKKQQPTIHRQLQILESNKFVISKRIKSKNRRLFYKTRFGEDYLKYHIEKNNLLKKYKFVLNHNNKEVKSFRIGRTSKTQEYIDFMKKNGVVVHRIYATTPRWIHNFLQENVGKIEEILIIMRKSLKS